MAPGAPSSCLSQHMHTHRLDVTAALGDTQVPAEDNSLCAGKQHHVANGGVSGKGAERSGLGGLLSVSVQNNSYPNMPLTQESTQMEKTILNLINKTLLLLTLGQKQSIY